MGFDSFFDSIGDDITNGADSIGNIGSSMFGGLETDFSSIFGGGSGSSTGKTNYLEYGLIAVAIIIIALIIKKLVK